MDYDSSSDMSLKKTSVSLYQTVRYIDRWVGHSGSQSIITAGDTPRNLYQLSHDGWHFTGTVALSLFSARANESYRFRHRTACSAKWPNRARYITGPMSRAWREMAHMKRLPETADSCLIC